MKTNNYQISFEFSLNDTSKQEWTDFWSTSTHSFPRQHYIYGEIEKEKKKIPVYVMGRINGKLSFVGIFIIQPLWKLKYSMEAACLRGPVYDDIEFGVWCLEEIIKKFTELRVGYVRIGPNWSFPEAERVESSLLNMGFSIYENFYDMGRRSTGIINIDLEDKDLLMSFDQSTRYEIRRANRLNITLQPAEINDDAILFYQNLKKMCQERGLDYYDNNEFRSMFHFILREKVLGIILNAYHGKEYLGGLLITKDSTCAHTTKFVVLTDKMKKLSNLRLAPIVFWHGMLWARDKGCKFIDLEGYRSDIKQAGHLQHVYEYKKGFNPDEVIFLGQYFIKTSNVIFFISEIYNKIFSLSQKPGQIIFKIRIWLINQKLKRIKRSEKMR